LVELFDSYDDARTCELQRISEGLNVAAYTAQVINADILTMSLLTL